MPSVNVQWIWAFGSGELKSFSNEKGNNIDVNYVGAVNWLIDWLVLFFVLIQNIFTQIETTSLPVKNCKCCPLLNAEGLWAGRDVSRVIAAKTSGPPKDRPFDHPLRLAWWRLILTRISKGAYRFMSGFLHLQRSDCALVSQNKLYNVFFWWREVQAST